MKLQSNDDPSYEKKKEIEVKAGETSKEIELKEGVEYNTTAYRVDLTSEDIANISVKLLETLKQDSITLNFIATKAKILNLPEEYTQVNNLTKQIDEQIKKIEDSEK